MARGHSTPQLAESQANKLASRSGTTAQNSLVFGFNICKKNFFVLLNYKLV